MMDDQASWKGLPLPPTRSAFRPLLPNWLRLLLLLGISMAGAVAAGVLLVRGEPAQAGSALAGSILVLLLLLAV